MRRVLCIPDCETAHFEELFRLFFSALLKGLVEHSNWFIPPPFMPCQRCEIYCHFSPFPWGLDSQSIFLLNTWTNFLNEPLQTVCLRECFSTVIWLIYQGSWSIEHCLIHSLWSQSTASVDSIQQPWSRFLTKGGGHFGSVYRRQNT